MNTDILPTVQGTGLALVGAQKVAAVLLALDKNVAQSVLKHFDQNELRRIAQDAARLGPVSTITLETLYEDLIDQISTNDDELVGDVDRAEDLLAGVISDEQVADIISDVRGASNQFVWRRVAGLPEQTLANYLSIQHPQTIAIILSKLDSAFAGKVLPLLSGETRGETMRRMLLSKPISDAALRVIESALQEDLFAAVTGPSSAEINSRVAGIINQLDREQIEEILAGISVTEPVVAAQLRMLVFSFEDIIKLSERARMVIFDQVPTEQVILALRGSVTEMRDAILPYLSTRTRRMVEAELTSPDMPPKRDIAAAQRQISNAVLRLAEQGLIELTEGGDAPQPE